MTRKDRRATVSRAAPIYQRVREILESARTNVARSVNTTQVVANWLIGREIFEEEQHGQDRAGYGESLIRDLANRLKENFSSGYSVPNLKYMRQFFREYPQFLTSDPIGHAVRGQLQSKQPRMSGKIGYAARGQSRLLENPLSIRHTAGDESWQPGQLHPNLSWTHYRTLLRVDSPEARGFYEIESIQNNWSARELERQINSLLFERLAKSKDKRGLMRLATKGHEIAQPADIFKDPVVIEFLGLPESPKLVESDLETALLDNLQAFLLDLRQPVQAVPPHGRRTARRTSPRSAVVPAAERVPAFGKEVKAKINRTTQFSRHERHVRCRGVVSQ